MTPERKVEILTRRLKMSQKFWVRAAKKALRGDMMELRNRVEMAEAPDVKVVLSDDNPTNRNSS